MANGNNEFKLSLEKFSKYAEEQFEIIFRKITIDLDSAIVMATPVDTGRARGNWYTSLNSPSATATERKGAGPAINEITSVAQKAKIGDTIWMANALPYINRLEYGSHSKQAPNGMVAVNVARFKSKYGI